MSLWKKDEIVDGGGMPLDQHAAALADALDLSERQRNILVAEIRNALVPDHIHSPTRGNERVLALMTALAHRRTR